MIKMSLTFSLELRTMAWVWGILTIWCWLFLPKGSHTRAGRFKLSIANSAINLDAVNIVQSYHTKVLRDFTRNDTSQLLKFLG